MKKKYFIKKWLESDRWHDFDHERTRTEEKALSTRAIEAGVLYNTQDPKCP